MEKHRSTIKSFFLIIDEFIRALQSMNKITLPTEVTTDNNNNNNNIDVDDKTEEELQQTTTELSSILGISSSFLQPTEEA